MYDTKKKISNSQTNAIPVNVQSQYEQQTGFSLQDVTIHYNSDKPKKLLASAYTQGSEVFLGSGKEKELKHELGHVIQQKAGMVKGKYTYQHMLFNDDQQLEHDSDVRRLPVNTGYRQSAVPVIQRRVLTNDELKDHFEKLAIEKISEDDITLIVNNVNASMTTDEISNTNYVPIHVFDELINDELPNIDSKQIMEASMHLQGFLKNVYVISGTCSRYKDDDGHLQIDKNTMTGEDISKRLVKPEYKERMLKALISIHNYTDEEGLISILGGSLTNVKDLCTYLENTDYSNEIFIKRLEQICRFIITVGNKTIEGELIKNHYTIRSSGSDPHMDGSHALILMPKIEEGTPLMYKEHSLEFENMVFGKRENNSMISKLNKLLIEHGYKALPLMDIDTTNHVEERINLIGGYDSPLSTIDDMNEKFRQLGFLESIAAVLGITDLHCENVGYDSDGPIILDGECGGDFSSTYMNADDIGVSRTKESNLINPSALYLENEQHIRQKKDKHYLEGQVIADVLLYKNKKDVLNQLHNNLNKVNYIRLVLLSTVILQEDFKTINLQGLININLDLRYKQALQTLQSDKWFFKGKDINLCYESFTDIYMYDLYTGILPAFGLIMKGNDAGTVLMDDQPVGSVNLQEKDLNNLYVNRVSTKIDERMKYQIKTSLHQLTGTEDIHEYTIKSEKEGKKNLQSITDLEGDGNTEEVEQIKKKESSRLETLELMKRDDQILSKMSDGILLIIQHSDRENGNEPREVLTVYINSILHTHKFRKRISAANIFNTDVFSLLLK